MPNRVGAKALMAAAVVITLATAAGCNQAGDAHGSAAKQTVTVPAAPRYTGPTVATYSKGALTKQELDEQYNLQVVLPGQKQNESKSQFVTYYVTWYEYLYNKATAKGDTKANLAKAKKLTNQTLRQLASSVYHSQADVSAKMKSLGLSKNDLIRYFVKQEYLQQFVHDATKDLKVSGTQAQKYYSRNKQDFVEITLRHILVNDKTTAKNVEQQLNHGAQFSALAEKYSLDSTVKQNSGVLKNLTISDLSNQYGSALAKAALKAPVGQLQAPLQTQSGYEIFRIDSRKQLSYPDVKNRIDQLLLPQLQQQKILQVYNRAVQDEKLKITVKSKDL